MTNPFDRETQAISRQAKIIAGVERLSTLFRSTLQEKAKHLGLSPLQVQIILFIAYHDKESCNTSSIAEEFAVTKPTVSDAIRVLIEKKILLKKQDTGDARAFVLTLSAKGEKVIGHLSEVSQPFSNAMNTAKESDIESAWNGILVLIQLLQQSKTIPIRMCFNCNFFNKDDAKGNPHYCNLMKKPLAIADIRIDCSEHEPLALDK